MRDLANPLSGNECIIDRSVVVHMLMNVELSYNQKHISVIILVCWIVADSRDNCDEKKDYIIRNVAG